MDALNLAASSLAYCEDDTPFAFARPRKLRPEPLADLAELGSADIETSLVANLSGDLHALFDPISEGTLPIYFGPLLGRLYLEGL